MSVASVAQGILAIQKPIREEMRQVQTKLDAYKRREEILSDVSFNAGYAWNSISNPVRIQVMDELQGSRGLHELFIKWAHEFDAYWEALDHRDPRKEDYFTEIDTFVSEKMNVLIVQIRLEG